MTKICRYKQSKIFQIKNDVDWENRFFRWEFEMSRRVKTFFYSFIQRSLKFPFSIMSKVCFLKDLSDMFIVSRLSCRTQFCWVETKFDLEETREHVNTSRLLIKPSSIDQFFFVQGKQRKKIKRTSFNVCPSIGKFSKVKFSLKNFSLKKRVFVEMSKLMGKDFWIVAFAVVQLDLFVVRSVAQTCIPSRLVNPSAGREWRRASSSTGSKSTNWQTKKKYFQFQQTQHFEFERIFREKVIFEHSIAWRRSKPVKLIFTTK